MNLTLKTIQLLKRLRDGEDLNVGEFKSEQQRDLIDFLFLRNGVSLKRIGKTRGCYSVTNPPLFQEACSQFDPILCDLDNAERLVTEELSRGKKVALFGNSKQGGAEKTMKGFSLLSDRKTSVEYLGEEVRIGPLRGLHVVDYSALVLPKDATVVIVENPE